MLAVDTDAFVRTYNSRAYIFIYGKVLYAFTPEMMMFFLIMLIGYICRKSGVFKDTTGKTISSIVINIGNPALIIDSGMNPERLENKGKLLFTLGVALIYFAIMLAVAELLPRLLHADREDYGAYQVMTLFPILVLWVILCWMSCMAAMQ